LRAATAARVVADGEAGRDVFADGRFAALRAGFAAAVFFGGADAGLADVGPGSGGAGFSADNLPDVVRGFARSTRPPATGCRAGLAVRGAAMCCLKYPESRTDVAGKQT